MQAVKVYNLRERRRAGLPRHHRHAAGAGARLRAGGRLRRRVLHAAHRGRRRPQCGRRGAAARRRRGQGVRQHRRRRESRRWCARSRRASASQCVVVSIDARKTGGGWTVVTRSGTHDTGLDPVGFARRVQELGAGEILLTSVDRDGTMEGYDVELTAAVSGAVAIPVIASGGAGGYAHMAEAVQRGRRVGGGGGRHLPLYAGHAAGSQAIPARPGNRRAVVDQSKRLASHRVNRVDRVKLLCATNRSCAVNAH